MGVDSLHLLTNSFLNTMKAMLLGLLFLLSAPTWAAEAGTPKLDIGKGGQCVKDSQWMRKNHMHLLTHQRDETVRQGGA
ncbi:MAG: hypothetical protein HY849_03625 [Nitrosomonadales bacterium]|nr:hypothetical protein [Nitrosomonadales bacterium]